MVIDLLEVKAELLRHEGIWWNGGIALLFLKFGTGWSCIVSLMPWPLYLGGKGS
jgi:hypothetical protein